jgi:23S rRNA pseudouridine1911/1915/1917 synthase
MPTDAPLVILWDDPHLIAVSKPAGLLTQGVNGGEPTLEEAVRRLIRPEQPASAYLGTVHRLDRPVSGVIVWAKTPKAARRLAEQFARREAKKEYWAVVEGEDLAREERWNDWLAPLDPMGVARIVTEGAPGARRAVTRAGPLVGVKVPEATALLRLMPETGRTHQLRAQTSLRGRPIVGDARYGASRPFPGGIALHARALTFAHPVMRQTITLIAEVPESWAEAGVIPLIRRS